MSPYKRQQILRTFLRRPQTHIFMVELHPILSQYFKDLIKVFDMLFDLFALHHDIIHVCLYISTYLVDKHLVDQSFKGYPCIF